MTWPSITHRSAPRDPADVVRQVIAGVRQRWMERATLDAFARCAAGVAVVWIVAAGFAGWTHQGLLPLVLFAAALGLSLAWCAFVLRRRPYTPTARDTARFIEEHRPDLDDRLVTAVDVLERTGPAGPLREAMLADAARAVADTSPEDVVPASGLRRVRILAFAAAVALLVAAVLWITPGRRAWSAALMQLMPGRFALDVTPGDVRLRPGTPLTIQVRTTASSTGAVPMLTVHEGPHVRTAAMRAQGEAFVWRQDAVERGFTYTIGVAGRQSPTYRVTVLEPPRVSRIDLRYEFPKYTGLANRTEEDGGDIYAPNGTRVTLAIAPSHAVTSGALVMQDGTRIPLQAASGGRWEAGLDVARDDAYRVALADADGLTSDGETEYFVRVLDDRPPEVRILRPAGDRQATPLEEVTIEARADDDYGIASFDLVYSIRGDKEHAVPLRGERSALSATGRRTLFLEDLKVAPGDFVTYYARVRDTGRGKKSTEARSDIYFIEVTPFEEQFAAAQSQAMSGAGGNRSLDDLVTTQKEIIVATWKLDRRSAAGRSAPDVRAVGKAQGELRRRAERAVSPLRDPRRRLRNPIGSSSRASDDALTNAVAAMARAEASLEAVDTRGALPAEMDALNQLLRAQAENTRREVMRQQAGGGGSNRSQADLSTLFDRELQRQQETNYETPRTSQDQQDEQRNGALDKLKELANRQEQLARQQEDLARNRQALTAEELKRRLERLTREQSELRRQAESLAQELARQRNNNASRQQARGAQGERGSSQGDQQAAAEALREASEEMRGAASDLRRDDPSQASKRSARALDRLRATERQMQASRPDDRRRALGDLQLEARQLAERQRSVADQARSAGQDADARRRAAGEQERLAERAGRLGEHVEQLARSGSGREREQVSEAARDLASQRVEARMRQAAEQLRNGTGTQATGDKQATDKQAAGAAGSNQAAGDQARRAEPADTRELARALDRVADRLGAAASGQGSDEGRMSEQIARAGDLRQTLSDLRRQIEQLERDENARGQQSGRQAGQAQDGRNGGAGDGKASGQAQAEREQRRQALENQYRRTLEEAERLQREAESQGRQGRGALGGTPEGQRMSLSAPGTEAFKQDFSQWDTLHKNVTLGLERLEASLSQKLLDKAAKDRVRAGAADRAPEKYQRAVDDYFRSLAAKP